MDQKTLYISDKITNDTCINVRDMLYKVYLLPKILDFNSVVLKSNIDRIPESTSDKNNHTITKVKIFWIDFKTEICKLFLVEFYQTHSSFSVLLTLRLWKFLCNIGIFINNFEYSTQCSGYADKKSQLLFQEKCQFWTHTILNVIFISSTELLTLTLLESPCMTESY